MNTHIMLDIETLGTGSHAAVLSIAAVEFDPWAKGDLACFHQGVTFESAMKYGRVDASTLEWWLKPERADARHTLNNLAKEDLDNVLFAFGEWVGLLQPDKASVRMWGNGATFDNVVVGNAYAAVGYDKPWGFHGDRCFRTLKSMAKVKPPAVVGVLHNALDDARLQVAWLQKIVRKLKLEVL